MKLRKLELCDAPFMLEWMHDEEVVRYMAADFASKTISDCKAFIETSRDTSHDLHLAVVDGNDDYMGTVSLKNISGGSAEFAIIMRRLAMGTGLSRYAMSEIMRIGFRDIGLKYIYWCVLPENKRAVRFYEKNGYRRIELNGLSIKGYTKEQTDNLLWFIERHQQ